MNKSISHHVSHKSESHYVHKNNDFIKQSDVDIDVSTHIVLIQIFNKEKNSKLSSIN